MERRGQRKEYLSKICVFSVLVMGVDSEEKSFQNMCCNIANEIGLLSLFPWPAQMVYSQGDACWS